MSATAGQGQTQAGSETIKATLGGTGTVSAWSEPRLQISAPAGIAQVTPRDHILAAGKSLSIATGHDTNLVAQGNHSLAVKDGLALFTVGKATNQQKPNQETGIHLHAASGSVSVQSQSGKTMAAADKKVTFASTTGKLTASAKQKVLTTAQGAYLKIEGGNIELHAPGKVELKASQKNLTGPKSASVKAVSFPQSDLSMSLAMPAKISEQRYLLSDNEGYVLAHRPYRIWLKSGTFVEGYSDSDGLTHVIEADGSEVTRIEILKQNGDFA